MQCLVCEAESFLTIILPFEPCINMLEIFSDAWYLGKGALTTYFLGLTGFPDLRSWHFG